MSGSTHPLKVSQELVKTYAQRRNSHLVSATGDGEHGEEPDPYAFVEGDEEFSFTEKKDKAGADREGNKKHKVGWLKMVGVLADICFCFSLKYLLVPGILSACMDEKSCVFPRGDDF